MPAPARTTSRRLTSAVVAGLAALGVLGAVGLPVAEAAGVPPTTQAGPSVAGPAAPAVVGEWPQLQGGAAHTGLATDTTLTRSALTRLAVAWSVPLAQPGGYAGPVVSGGLVYVEEHGLSAYRVSDGSRVWHTDLPVGAVLPSTTPAVGDGLVFFAGLATDRPHARGGVWALDATTGGLQWQRSFPDGIYRAPTFAGQAVYVTSGGHVTKLRASSGRVVWESPAAASSPPTVVGNRVFVSDQGIAEPLSISSLDAATGAVVWTRPLSASGGCASYEGGTVLVSDTLAYAGDCYGVLRAVGRFGGRQVWQTTAATDAFFWPMALAGGRLVNTETRVSAYDAATGSPSWSALPSDGGEFGYPSPVVVGSTVVVPGGHSLDLRDVATGALVGNVDVFGGQSPQFTAVAQGRLFVVADDQGHHPRLVALAPAP